jgi:hypothetical protein
MERVPPKKSRICASWSVSRLEPLESSHNTRLHVGRAQDTQGVSWPPRSIEDVPCVFADVFGELWGRDVVKVANYSCATRSDVGVLTEGDHTQENDGICRHDSI